MSRLTKKIDSLKYVPTTEKLVSVEEIIYKLGKFEDLMERHKIRDYRTLGFLIKDHKRLSDQEMELNADLGMLQNENDNITKDIEKYWKIQEEIGCPLEVVFKKIQELTIERWDEVHCLQYDENKKLWYIISYSLWDDEFCPNGQYYLKDYKKTWWLKEGLKEIEKEIEGEK